MRTPRTSFTPQGLQAALEVMAKHVTKLERQGEADSWRPKRFVFTRTAPNNPEDGEVYWDGAVLKIYSGSSDTWVEIS